MAPISDSNATYGFDQVAAADIINTEAVYGALTVTTTPIEVRVGSTRLENRKLVMIYNNSNVTLFFGFNSAVNSTNGMPLPANTSVTLAIGDNLPIFIVASSGSRNIRIIEAS